MSQRPYLLHSDDPEDEDENNIKYLIRITDLTFKYLKKTITPEEKLELDEWIERSEQNKKLFNTIPQTDNTETIFAWILKRFWQDRNRPEWN